MKKNLILSFLFLLASSPSSYALSPDQRVVLDEAYGIERLGSANVEAIVNERGASFGSYHIETKITFSNFPNLYKFNGIEFTELGVGLGALNHSSDSFDYAPENGSTIIIPFAANIIFSAQSDEIALNKISPTYSGYPPELKSKLYLKNVYYDIPSYENAKNEIKKKESDYKAARAAQEKEDNSIVGRIKNLFGR